MAHVNDESTLVVFDGYERQELEVLFQDEVVLDIEVPLFYIKSGEEEIQHYVDTVAKPDLDNHTTSKKAELDTYTGLKKEEISDFSLERQGIIEENLDNYADNTLKPQLNEFVTAAETAAGNAQASAVASSGSAAAALDSETAAASSAATAAATVNGFDAHAAENKQILMITPRQRQIPLTVIMRPKRLRLIPMPPIKRRLLTTMRRVNRLWWMPAQARLPLRHRRRQIPPWRRGR